MKMTTIPNRSILLGDVNEETLAAWLDGMLSPEESEAFVSSLESDGILSALLDDYDDIMESYESLIVDGYDLPEEFQDSFPFPLPVDLADELYDSETMDQTYLINEEANNFHNGIEMFDEDTLADEGMFADEPTKSGYIPDNAAIDSYNLGEPNEEACMAAGDVSEGNPGANEYLDWQDDQDNQDIFDEPGFC